MAWERRQDTKKQYYYRSRRLPDGRIVKTYCGTGERGARAAEADRERRAEENARLQRHRAVLEYIHRVAAPVDELCRYCDLIMRAALIAAETKITEVYGENSAMDGQTATLLDDPKVWLN